MRKYKKSTLHVDNKMACFIPNSTARVFCVFLLTAVPCSSYSSNSNVSTAMCVNRRSEEVSHSILVRRELKVELPLLHFDLCVQG